MHDQYSVLLQYLNPPGPGRVLEECTKEVPHLTDYADTVFSNNILYPCYFIHLVNSCSLTPITFLFLIHSLSLRDLFTVLYLVIRKTSPVSYPSILRFPRFSKLVKPILYFLILYKLKRLDADCCSHSINSSEFARHARLSTSFIGFPVYFLSYLLVLPLSFVLHLPSTITIFSLCHGMKTVSSQFLLSNQD